MRGPCRDYPCIFASPRESQNAQRRARPVCQSPVCDWGLHNARHCMDNCAVYPAQPASTKEIHLCPDIIPATTVWPSA
jgi:hypothetical protein